MMVGLRVVLRTGFYVFVRWLNLGGFAREPLVSVVQVLGLCSFS